MNGFNGEIEKRQNRLIFDENLFDVNLLNLFPSKGLSGLKVGLLTIVTNLKLKQAWKRALNFIVLLGIISLNAYPISRAAGAMYQSARGNAIVKVN